MTFRDLLDLAKATFHPKFAKQNVMHLPYSPRYTECIYSEL